MILEKCAFQTEWESATVGVMSLCQGIFEAATRSAQDGRDAQKGLSVMMNDDIFHDLTRHEDARLRLGACQLLRIMLKRSTAGDLKKRQATARHHGGLLWQYGNALLAEDSVQRKISEELVGLFCDGSEQSTAVIERSVPHFLFVRTLGKPAPAQRRGMASSPSQAMLVAPEKTGRKDMRKSKSGVFAAVKNEDSTFQGGERRAWAEFFKALTTREYNDEMTIWNKETLTELEEQVTAEIVELDAYRAHLGRIEPWDAGGFSVTYKAYESSQIVAGFFLQKLVPRMRDREVALDDEQADTLMRHLYSAMVLEDDRKKLLFMVEAMTQLLLSNPKVSPGFPVSYTVWLFDPARLTEDMAPFVMQQLQRLLRLPQHVKKFHERGGVPHIVHFLRLGYARLSEQKPLYKPDRAYVGELFGLLTLLSGYYRVKRALGQDYLKDIVQGLMCEPATASKALRVLSDVLECSPDRIPNLWGTNVFVMLVAMLTVAPAAVRSLPFSVLRTCCY